MLAAVGFAISSFAVSAQAARRTSGKVVAKPVAHMVPTPVAPGGPDLKTPPTLSPQEIADRSIRISNPTGKPFTYQIARTSGPTWSKTYTVDPGTSHTFMASIDDPRKQIMTLDATGSRYMMIRFPMADGWMIYKLTVNKTNEPLIKTYAYTVNANGFGDLFEPRPDGTTIPLPPGKENQRLLQLYRAHSFERK
jgi:hypothetical protein